MKARVLVTTGIALAFLSVLAGCASRDHSGASAMLRTPPMVPTGVWRGTISGLEMADAQGIVSAGAQLTIRPDETFVLEDSSGARATGQARIAGDTILLDGTFVSPASRAGEPVTDWLQLGAADALYGRIDTIFRGLRVTGDAGLRKVR